MNNQPAHRIFKTVRQNTYPVYRQLHNRPSPVLFIGILYITCTADMGANSIPDILYRYRDFLKKMYFISDEQRRFLLYNTLCVCNILLSVTSMNDFVFDGSVVIAVARSLIQL